MARHAALPSSNNLSSASRASGIRDNRKRGKAGEYLKQHLSRNSLFAVVSAYFTIHAYDALRNQLADIKELRFLFGEPKFLRSLDRTQKESKFFALTEQGLRLENQLKQSNLARQCAAWIKEKVQIRSVKQSSLLHGKMYHIANGSDSHALLGSSNFTSAGLGLGYNSNVELNLVVDSRRDREDLLEWFEEWWSNEDLSEDVRDQVLEELKRVYENQAPQFIYYLTLFHIFRDFLDDQENADDELRKIELTDTKIWETLYQFQKDGSKAAINKLRQLNGCILADSVGLGKTYTALGVIKYFELKNERVLVLCPKKLRNNWILFRNNSSLNPFLEDSFRYDVLSHTDLSRATGSSGYLELASLNWGNYDLVVIDESHNFRNNIRAKKTPGEPIRQTRYEKLLQDVIKAGISTKVLLLSATPVNNELSDLRNQISFIAGGDVSREAKADAAFRNTLDIKSVQNTTNQAQKQFSAWFKKEAQDRTSETLLRTIGGDFFKLLDGLSIARSRTQIRTYYAQEMERLGSFPKRTRPVSLHPAIDKEEGYLSFEDLEQSIDQLNLALYHPTHYLRADLPEETRKDYQNEVLNGFTQEARERVLICMMKVNFLKRLESSVHSFRTTLERTIGKITSLEEKLSAFAASMELDYETLIQRSADKQESDDDLEDELAIEEQDFLVGGKHKLDLRDIDTTAWQCSIKQDKERLQGLLNKTAPITVQRDAKLAELRSRIAKKIAQPTINKDGEQNRKVLIFTAFADTAKYLYANLHEELGGMGVHTALIIGDGHNENPLGKKDYDEILTNFSPRAKNRADQKEFPQEEEIDVLIATDCISEGQNLQDCDLLINYDIHWNPVRIIQRFGRIDRIGSRNEAVHLINFWPVKDLDRYLKVKHRVEARMALVDLSATQTDNLLEDEQLEERITHDLLFRNRQLKRLQEEVLDLEELDDQVSLTDFSLEEFRQELWQFLAERRKEFEAAPLGLYAVVPPNTDAPPGALFCLRHRQTTQATPSNTPRSKSSAAHINPLSPYYLVYVLDDNTVQLGFAQPKQALDLFRKLAAGCDTAHEELCDLFDRKTQDGADMSQYSKLVQEALSSITQTFHKRSIDALLMGRDGKLPMIDEVPTEEEQDYELLSWLVILGNDNKEMT